MHGDQPPRLESLPNELLLGLFQYFPSRDLFRAFHHLNARFNALLYSFPYLSLTLSTPVPDDSILVPFVRTLLVERAVDCALTRFADIRRLTLHYPTGRLLEQLTAEILPHLEHLSLNYMDVSLHSRIPTICQRVFANGFPRLKSCRLFQWSTIAETNGWTQLASLAVLRTGKIDLFVYKCVLLACPNLSVFQFSTVTSKQTPLDLRSHANLRRMIVKTTAFIEPWHVDDLRSCLSYVPNLEYLSIHRTDRSLTIERDWLASSIDSHLPCLRRFHFHLHIAELQCPFTTMTEQFTGCHPDRYQSRLSFVG